MCKLTDTVTSGEFFEKFALFSKIQGKENVIFVDKVVYFWFN